MSWGNLTFKIPFKIKAGWAIRYNMLDQKKSVVEDVNAYRKANDMPPQRFPAQSFSHVKTDLEHGMKTENPEVLEVCRRWGLDVTKPLHQQNRSDVAAAWERIKAELEAEQS